MSSADWDRRHQARATERWDDATRYLSDIVGPAGGRDGSAELEASPGSAYRAEPFASRGAALDLACGTGGAAAWLAEAGWEVTGVDFSPVALGIAASRAPSVTWLEADLRTWQAEPGAYNLVHIAYLHLPQQTIRAVLEMAARALAPNGRLILVGHAVANATEGVGGPSNPAVLYDVTEVVRWLAEAGLDIEDARIESRPVAGETRRALDVVVVAQRKGNPE
jgi:SAM-dependent methyltransferase